MAQRSKSKKYDNKNKLDKKANNAEGLQEKII